MISIGELKLKTSRPKDLDERLQNACGINAAEMATHLRGYPRAQTVARALVPFLEEGAPGFVELAGAISAQDVGTLQGEVLALYAKDDQPAADAGAGAGA